MKVVLSSVSFATPYTPQLRFLSLGYLHANAMADEVIAAKADIVHQYYDPSLRSADQIADAIAEGALAELRVLKLSDNALGDGLFPLSEAFARGNFSAKPGRARR